MIKSIRPGKLRGYDEDRIERSIINLMGYECSYTSGSMRIGPVDDYENPKYLLADVFKLKPIGSVHIVGTKKGVFVEIDLNERALEIIADRDKKEEINNDCKNTVSGSESANC